MWFALGVIVVAVALVLMPERYSLVNVMLFMLSFFFLLIALSGPMITNMLQ